MSNSERPDILDWFGLRRAMDWSKARWLGPLLSVVVMFLFLMALVAAGAMLLHALVGIGLGTPRAGFGTGAVTVAVLGAPFVIWRAVVAQRQADIAQEGHITDRINTAVQGLGAEKEVKRDGVESTEPNLEVRIGAIYALERIAQDSARDHVQIMEILCAYIRQNAPAPEADDWPVLKMKESEDDGPLEADWEERLAAFREAQEQAKAGLKLREDIQVALTVIGRRRDHQRQLEAGRGVEAPFPFDREPPEYDGPEDGHDPATLAAYLKKLEEWQKTLHSYDGYRLDLRNADLRGADLSHLNLNGARLDGTCLQGANLRAARLRGALLGEVRLDGADLRGARMQGAMLLQAGLQGADLRGTSLQRAALAATRLQGADLHSAQLRGTIIVKARLQGADLRMARLQGADLLNARLQRADIRVARLQGANFQKARLQGAHLLSARMQDAILEQTLISGASLVATCLRGVHFNAILMDERTGLIEAELAGVALQAVDLTDFHQFKQHLQNIFGDGSVTLPEGVTRPAHWPRHKLGEFIAEWRKWQADPESYEPPEETGG